MRLHGFADELISIRPSTEIVKIASNAKLIARMAALGAAVGLGGQAVDVGRAAIAGDPYLMPQQSSLAAAGRGAIGGAAAGAVLAALSKMFK